MDSRKNRKLLTLRTQYRFLLGALLMLFFACEKEKSFSLKGTWKLEKYSCDAYSNYRQITFFFDTIASAPDSAWYIDPLVLNDTVFVKYKLSNQNSLLIIDNQVNGWNGTYPFSFFSASNMQITRNGNICGSTRYSFKK